MCPECQCDNEAGAPGGEEQWQFYFCPVEFHFPQRTEQKSPEADLRDTDYSPNFVFVPAMNLKELKPYRAI